MQFFSFKRRIYTPSNAMFTEPKIDGPDEIFNFFSTSFRQCVCISGNVNTQYEYSYAFKYMTIARRGG